MLATVKNSNFAEKIIHVGLEKDSNWVWKRIKIRTIKGLKLVKQLKNIYGKELDPETVSNWASIRIKIRAKKEILI